MNTIFIEEMTHKLLKMRTIGFASCIKAMLGIGDGTNKKKQVRDVRIVVRIVYLVRRLMKGLPIMLWPAS